MNSDFRATQRISKLMPLAEVFRKIDALVMPVRPHEIGLGAACGRVLAAKILAPFTLPERPVALRDGWAVRADQIADASAYSPVPLSPKPQWMEIGDPLPSGADSILPPDALAANRLIAEALAPTTVGDGVLAAGSDTEARANLLRAGERLRAIDLAILQSAAIKNVSIREPKILITRTNTKIRDDEDSVTPFVIRLIETLGGRAKINAKSSVEGALDDRESDALIIIGGSGAGKSDKSALTLARMGHLEIHGIGIQPGETAAFGTANARPVLIVPGRLDAALSIVLILGQRLFVRLSGAVEEDLKISVKLCRKLASQVGIAEFVPIKRTEDGALPLASGNIPVHAFAQADGWILVPAESEGYAAGMTVEMRMFP